MKTSTLWKKEELIIVLNLYWKIPYNKISGSSNNQIKEMARVIGRTPASVAYKLMNFTIFDQERQKQGNKGKEGAGKLDEIVWNEYLGEWERLANDSTTLLSEIQSRPAEEIINIEEEIADYVGKEREQIVKIRINQYDFRQRILASYNEKCCITGIDIPNLLVASHIIPWSVNEKERLNPRNGLCLNSLYDKAFDKGLLTITSDFRVRFSKKIMEKKSDSINQEFFWQFDNKSIALPDRYLPDTNFLIWHNTNVFEKFDNGK